ncbi:MAG TPA: hemolysin III family protein [Fimbriiglobus sp.]|nr:hemolysin III family protein [Fimbriiglobus sp.]
MTNSYDLVSSTTHLVTAAWAAYATLILVRLTRGHGPGRWAVGFFGLSMVLLYLASGTFHGARLYTRETDRLFQRLDKSAIFLLIAGSYVPVFVYLLRDHWRRWALAAMLGIAAAGIASLWLLPDLPHPQLVGIYAGMGVVGFITAPKIVASAGWSGVGWIVAVAVCYLGGAAVEVLKWPVLVPGWVGPHEVLHVADMLGTAAMFIFVTRHVIRRPPLAVKRHGRQLASCA